MKILLLFGLFLFSTVVATGQNPPASPEQIRIDRHNLQIRPNSRDYTMVRRGNEHQRLLMFRIHDKMIRRQALLNRKQAMDRQREMMQHRMIRQQLNRQRMVHQRNIHR